MGEISFFRPAIVKILAFVLIKARNTESSGTCARQLKLESTTGAPLQMFEVQAFSSAVNKALSKVAIQSSNYGDSFTAFKAVDGFANTFSHTYATDVNAWWMVDFGESDDIESVNILNRYCV